MIGHHSVILINLNATSQAFFLILMISLWCVERQNVSYLQMLTLIFQMENMQIQGKAW